MPLMLIDALSEGQVIINTDHVIAVRVIEGQTTVFLREGHSINVPHESPAALFDHMGDAVPIA